VSKRFEFLLFVLLKSEEWPGESGFAIGQQIFLLSAASCSVFSSTTVVEARRVVVDSTFDLQTRPKTI
jgi:hypothetical protein